MSIKPLVAGNWKMNGLKASYTELQKIAQDSALLRNKCDVTLCVPSHLIVLFSQENLLPIGGQNCHHAGSGAYTGDISAMQLRDVGASSVIVGHSERRLTYVENNKNIAAKAVAAHKEGLLAIICVGESEKQRDEGETLKVIEKQIRESLPATANADNTVIAYEPIWAIGTGRIPSVTEITEAHDFMRALICELIGEAQGKNTRLLYGGSVKPDNAEIIAAIANVNGALVGGASLKASDFLPIIQGFANQE